MRGRGGAPLVKRLIVLDHLEDLLEGEVRHLTRDVENRLQHQLELHGSPPKMGASSRHSTRSVDRRRRSLPMFWEALDYLCAASSSTALMTSPWHFRGAHQQRSFSSPLFLA